MNRPIGIIAAALVIGASLAPFAPVQTNPAGTLVKTSRVRARIH
jgi:hypothetical protein